jgi:hypothetical protein
MKFILTAPAFVDGKYVPASVRDPVVHELPDTIGTEHISRHWKPACKKAKAALEKLGVKAAVTTADEVAEGPAVPSSPIGDGEKAPI